MGKECVVGLGGMGDEAVHVFLSVALGDVGDVHTLVRVSGLHEGFVGGDVFVADALDEDVGGGDAVGVGDEGAAACGAQLDGHVDGVFGHRQEEDVFKRFPHFFGFGVGEPFLEECGEGVFVDHASVFCPNGDVAVALGGYLGQVLPLAIPAGDGVQPDDGDFLFVHVAGEIVIDAQGFVFKIIIELLRGGYCGSADDAHGQEDFLHTGICIYCVKLELKLRGKGRVKGLEGQQE